MDLRRIVQQIYIYGPNTFDLFASLLQELSTARALRPKMVGYYEILLIVQPLKLLLIGVVPSTANIRQSLIDRMLQQKLEHSFQRKAACQTQTTSPSVATNDLSVIHIIIVLIYIFPN